MKNGSWKLFEPVTIRNLKIKNRIVMLPMGNNLHSSTGEVTHKLIDYYEEVAQGGAGIIIVQAAYITDEFGGSRLRIDSNDFIPGLNQLAETIKSWGARAGIQINHRGYPSPGEITINDLADHRIQKLIEAFGKAAERAKGAGFEMVEIHGGHGYLIAQFLSGLTNQRADAYGGPLEKRMAFPIQVYQKVREAVGENFPISFRMSGDEFIPGGIGLDDTKKLSGHLEKEGLNLVSLTAGKGPDTREWFIQPMAFPRGCLTTLSQELKKSVKLPILIAGRINDPVLANSILEEGRADLIGMGRGLIADPHLPKKALSGELDEIRKCIGCNFCHGKRFILALPLKCAINPGAGRERETVLTPAQTRKRVLIIGGGPSGLECAHMLVERGHEVLLFERAPVLGGRLRVAAIPPHKEEINELLDFLIKRAKREKVSVFLNHEADRSTIQDLDPDVLVLATGAKPIFPDIPGLSKGFCYTAEEALTQNLIERDVIVLGAGLVGCETADFLLTKGKKVTLVEKLPDLGLDLEPITRKVLLRRISERDPVIHTSTEIVNIGAGNALLRDRTGNESFSRFDVIVLAVGYTAADDLVQAGGFPELETHTIGDCSTPRGIFEAIHEGNRVGRLI